MEKLKNINNPTLLNERLGSLIKKLRKSRKMSGEVLAGFIGVSQQQLSRYERGESELTIKKIAYISMAFNMNIWQFMDILYITMQED